MEILLKKDVANLGYAGEIVKVKAGYAVNYLVPQGFATVATESVKKQHAETLRQRAHKEAKIVADAQAFAEKLSGMLLTIPVKVNSDGKIFGSVSAAQVVDALAAAGIEVDKKAVTVPEIKEAGEFEAAVKCYKNVVGNVKLNVIAE